MSNWNLQFFTRRLQRIVIAWYKNMSFVIDKTITDKVPKKTVVSQFTGNNSTIFFLFNKFAQIYHNYLQ
jgi:hypothetical protein